MGLRLLVCCALFASSSASKNPVRLIGYVDADAQLEMASGSTNQTMLTHIVLVNALKVDSQGVLYLRPKAHPDELATTDLIKQLATLPPKLVLSIRGYMDDVALDELAEDDIARPAFARNMASQLKDWNVSGLEVEWHAADPAGGKAVGSPFDSMEQFHYALLCRDLAVSLWAAGDKTLSVAVNPGMQEFWDSTFVQRYLSWVTIGAYSMRSLADPHPSSLKDMSLALKEWTDLGVPRRQLVLAVPLFGHEGLGALSSAASHRSGKRLPWRQMLVKGRALRGHSNGEDDTFIDEATGKVWSACGPAMMRAKVAHVYTGGYGGVAFRELNQDAGPGANGKSLVQVAFHEVERMQRENKRVRRPWSLLQHGVKFSRTEQVPTLPEL